MAADSSSVAVCCSPSVLSEFKLFAELPEQFYTGVRQETVHLCTAEGVSRKIKHFVEEEPGVRQRAFAPIHVKLLIADNCFVDVQIEQPAAQRCADSRKA